MPFNIYFIVSVIPCFTFFWNLVSINETESLMIPAKSLICFFNMGNIEWSNSLKIGVDVCGCMFCFIFL